MALYACIKHLEKTQNPKIVFLVPRVPLVKQQFELFKRCKTSRLVLYCILVVTFFFFELASQMGCSVGMFKLSRKYFSLGEVYSFTDGASPNIWNGEGILLVTLLKKQLSQVPHQV